MIKKFILGAVLAIAGVSSAMAQTTDYKKGEFYVGYSNSQVDTGQNQEDSVQNFFEDRLTFHGFETAGVYNVSRYVGIKGDVSGVYRSQRVNTPVTVGNTTGNVNFNTRLSVYNFLGGVQIKDNASEKRVKPFAHALAGAGHVRFNVKDVNCTNFTPCPSFVATESKTGFAAAIGGGLDVKVNNKVDFRVIQVDYNPIRIEGSTGHTFRFGAGIVIK